MSAEHAEFVDRDKQSGQAAEGWHSCAGTAQREASSKCWAEALLKIARMTLTIKLDGNWSSFQLANSAPPLSVTDSAVAPSARMMTCLILDRNMFFNL